jgi:hypothetical protein
VKGEKIGVIRQIQASLQAANLPEMPTDCLLDMSLVSLYKFKDRWVSPVVGKIIGERKS